MACSPAPQWVAVSAETELLLYSPDLTRADTIELASALLPSERITHLIAGAGGAGLYLVAASDTAGAIITLRRRDLQVVDRANLAGVPTAAAMHPDGHSLLVAVSPGIAETQQRSMLRFVPLNAARTEALAELCRQPARAMVTFRALERLYVACDGGEIAEIDLRLRARIRSVRFAEPQDHSGEPCGPAGAGLSSNATLVYVLCRDAGALFYLERARLTLFDSLPVGAGVSSLAMTPNRRHAVITWPARDAVALIDLRRRREERRIVFPGAVSSGVSSDGRWMYVVGSAGVLRIDLARPRMMGEPAPLSGSSAVAVWPGHSSPIMRW